MTCPSFLSRFAVAPALVVPWILAACQTPAADPTPGSPVVTQEDVAASAPDAAMTAGGSVAPEAPASPVAADDPNCEPFTDTVKEPPFYVASEQILVARVAYHCQAKGRKGYKRGSPWLAMGFPCTAGGGRLSWSGMQVNPKAIHFEMSNGCPTAAPAVGELTQRLVRHKALPADARVAAVYPFGLQYWQLRDYPDQDVGDVVDFVSQESLTKGWKRFLADTPVRITMFGRLNSFVADPQLFAVDAELIHDGRRSFKVKVLKAEALTEDARRAARARCQELGASRNCGEIFDAHPGQ